MRFSKELEIRCGSNCEICGSDKGVNPFLVAPKEGKSADDYAMLCLVCSEQLSDDSKIVPNHWRVLNDAMWSEVSAVKVLSYRMLTRLKSEGWPNELLEMMYLEEEDLSWAKDGMPDEDALPHLDSNGAILVNGDTVVLIKDLDVKGANFTAKRGTAVRNIRLVHDNPEQIEGKVNGQSIVILTQYVKK